MEGSAYAYDVKTLDFKIITKEQVVDFIQKVCGNDLFLQRVQPSWYINLKNNFTYEDMVNNDKLSHLFKSPPGKKSIYIIARDPVVIIIAFDKTQEDVKKTLHLKLKNETKNVSIIPNSKKVQYDGKFIQVVSEEAIINGTKTSRLYIPKRPAVAIAAMKDDKMIIVKQLRVPVHDTIYELPAGLVDNGEDPKTAALRELKEETGFTAKQISPIFSGYSSPGFTDEKIYLFYATGLVEGQTNFDGDEFVEYELWSPDECKQAIKSGKIVDMKTIAAIFALF